MKKSLQIEIKNLVDKQRARLQQIIIALRELGPFKELVLYFKI